MVKKVRPKPLLLLFIFFLFLCIGSFMTWQYLEGPVDKNDTEEVEIKIESGTSSTRIGEILKEKKLIKSTLLFKIHLKIEHVESLKASTYKFSKSMSLSEIIRALEQGVVSNEGAIKITFREGERIPDYAEDIADSLKLSSEEVINILNNEEYLKELISKYWFLTEDILQDGIYYPLEGYLAPETYFFDKDADVYDVIERLLNQMDANLEEYKMVVEKDPHYYLTMASIVQLEGTNTENRKMIVGVFENRLSNGMNLGSDVTTYYALQRSMKEDLSASEFATVNPYNTRGGGMIGKMPIGPICNPSMSAIEASVEPTENDNFFFVADKYGKIYFTKNNAEHDKKVAEIKANGDWIFE